VTVGFNDGVVPSHDGASETGMAEMRGISSLPETVPRQLCLQFFQSAPRKSAEICQKSSIELSRRNVA
jgi:hypothetical protein